MYRVCYLKAWMDRRRLMMWKGVVTSRRSRSSCGGARERSQHKLCWANTVLPWRWH